MNSSHGVTDAVHFLLQELRAADPNCSEEEPSGHAFSSPFVLGREKVSEIRFILRVFCARILAGHKGFKGLRCQEKTP